MSSPAESDLQTITLRLYILLLIVLFCMQSNQLGLIANYTHGVCFNPSSTYIQIKTRLNSNYEIFLWVLFKKNYKSYFQKNTYVGSKLFNYSREMATTKTRFVSFQMQAQRWYLFSQSGTFSTNYKSTSLTKYLSKTYFLELLPTNVCNSTAASKEISGLVIYGSWPA